MIRYLIVLILLTSCVPGRFGKEDKCTILFLQKQQVIMYYVKGPERDELIRTIDSLALECPYNKIDITK